MPNKTRTLRLILGDQLDHNHSWFSDTDASTVYLIAELHQETNYVRHHIQKVAAFYVAMRVFAEELQEQGHNVTHLTLDDTRGYDGLPDLLAAELSSTGATTLEYQWPDEFRLREQLASLSFTGVEIKPRESEHFIVPSSDLDQFFEAGKPARMEHFYRKMRKKLNILMDKGEPLGGQWNYDELNRKKLKAKDIAAVPAPHKFVTCVDDVIDRLARHDIETIGTIDGELLWPVNRQQSLELLTHFCQHCLPLFGRFQDAMTCQSPDDWSLYHSRLSFALNSKMLSPIEVVQTAITAFEAPQSDIPLSSIEGFVRQIIGWREFIRGIYWVNMPDYGNLNALNAKRRLPAFFWTGNTKMKCLSSVINQSLDKAYAHHIQRLMITGNFCLLAGIDPVDVDAWYLGIYIDAIEWVEMPNTRGMSQFADGGLVGSKPYAAGGNYINKMSDYCGNCEYSVKKKFGPGACPMNSLYWQFMVQHRERLESNPRTGMIYKNWDRSSEDHRRDMLSYANACLDDLDAL